MSNGAAHGRPGRLTLIATSAMYPACGQPRTALDDGFIERYTRCEAAGFCFRALGAWIGAPII
jgi:hypothetical protein